LRACLSRVAARFALVVDRDDKIPVLVDIHLVVWVDNSRATPRLDDGGPSEGHAWPKELSVVDRRLVRAFGGVVDAAAAFTCVERLTAVSWKRRRRELSHLCDRDDVCPDELDGGLEAIGVLALVGAVESL